jgi:GNAT superfamily N-acetyltransferase
VCDFLTATYRHETAGGNWIEPRWEYMHYHPHLDDRSLHKIGIWEDSGRIVAVANYEDKPGTAFFQLRQGYEHLKPEMLAYSEAHLSEELSGSGRKLRLAINDFDLELQALAVERGYVKNEQKPEWESRFDITEPFPNIEVPTGFKIKSLADEFNLRKVHRVMWRGFNHPGEPPEEGIEWRRRKLSAPSLRNDLTVVVEAPDGNFASFCGMWYDSTHRFAFVEPVATDPDYRRMGLGKAAVLEGIRRCKELGATVAYVGSGQPFYEALGFRKTFAAFFWVREWDQTGRPASS